MTDSAPCESLQKIIRHFQDGRHRSEVPSYFMLNHFQGLFAYTRPCDVIANACSHYLGSKRSAADQTTLMELGYIRGSNLYYLFIYLFVFKKDQELC